MTTGLFWDERCMWHGGGNYAQLLPVGGLVQPLVAGGLPEAPEGKRRLKNLLDVTGLSAELAVQSAAEATREQLLRVHPASYLDPFKALSDGGGGELGLRTPFGPGGFEIASLSAGLVTEAAQQVASGKLLNAYAISRPPGHHCTADWANGFCLLNNIAVAARNLQTLGLAKRIAIVDWDVHHGNGTEAIFYGDPSVLTISLHQERNYPRDTGFVDARGEGAGVGANVNIPLPPGAGHNSYLEAMDRIVLPVVSQFQPDFLFVASGFDASGVDPLSRTLCRSKTFRAMTERLMTILEGRMVCAHEGGYSDVHVPFCGHAVIQQLSGSAIVAPDPLDERITAQQPNARVEALFGQMIGEIAEVLVS